MPDREEGKLARVVPREPKIIGGYTLLVGGTDVISDGAPFDLDQMADKINSEVSRLIQSERRDAAVKALERAAGLCGGNRMCDGACEKNIRALADRVKSGEETP